MDDAFLIPLPCNNELEPARLQQEGLAGQAAQLGDPQARAEQQLQDHDVPQGLAATRGVCAVGGAQQLPHQLGRNGSGQLPDGGQPQMQPVERVLRQMPRGGQIPAEHAHAGQLALDGAGRKAPVQVADVLQQDGFVHLRTAGKVGKLP